MRFSRGPVIVSMALVVAAGGAAIARQSIPRGADVARQLPAPDPSKAGTRFAKVVGWPAGTKPAPASGFAVDAYAAKLTSPRWPYVLPNGDVLVSESTGKATGPNRVVLLRDANKDGVAEETHALIRGVRQPFGLLLKGSSLYVGATNALLRYSFTPGQTQITGAPTKLLNLPVGEFNYHWTRDVVASADGSKLFISVGSGTNVDEEKSDVKEPRRASVLEVNPDGSGMRIFASGLRNPVGLAVNPVSKALWTVVNERDMLGDELVPDYLTSVKEGAFYGWPYCVLRTARGSPQERGAAGSRGQGDPARLRARRARGAARRAVLPGHVAAGAVSQRRIRVTPRVVESHALLRVQGGLRTDSRTANRRDRWKTCSPGSSRTRRPTRCTGVQWDWLPSPTVP